MQSFEKGDNMSSIGNVPASISKLIQAVGEKTQTDNQIAFAVAGKQLKASKQTGEAVVQMLEQVVDLQSQLANGRLDVKA
jgi:hypothetical protein